jgi:hypothetical protein
LLSSCRVAAFNHVPGRNPGVEDVETSLGDEVGETHDVGWMCELGLMS